MPKDDATLSAASAGSHGLSEAEIDALEYVVVEGRIACMEDYGILRSLLVRLRPEWETNHDAAPAARATEPESSVPLGSGVVPANTTSPPGSSAALIKRKAERQSPAYAGGGEPLDDCVRTMGSAPGGRGHFPDSRT